MKSRSVSTRTAGPCGVTTVSEAEVTAAKQLFRQQLPSVTSGLSIVQELASAASTVAATTRLDLYRNDETNENTHNSNETDCVSNNRYPLTDPYMKHGLSMSRRVVNSHLEFFRKFPPFLEGRFTKDTIYEFLFFAVVENRLRMSYAKRVLRNLLTYARRYLADRGGDRLLVAIPRAGDRSTTLDITLTPESVAFFRDNPRGNVVQSKRFYQLVNSIGEQTNNERLKNVVCEARTPRELVFSKQEHSTLLAFVFRALRVFVLKYVLRSHQLFEWVNARTKGRLVQTSDKRDDISRVERAVESLVSSETATSTSRRQTDTERVMFEFCVAFVFGFLTGARVKSTVMRLTVAEIDNLIRGETLEKYTKGSFARLFLPADLTRDNRTARHYDCVGLKGYDPSYWTLDLRDQESVSSLLYGITLVRRDPMLYPARRVCKHIGSGGECGYGVYRQCRKARICGVGGETIVPRLCRNKAGVISVGCPYGYAECNDTIAATPQSVESQSFFLSGGRQLDYMFDSIYEQLFLQRRPKGVFWHSQRRAYLGSVNEKCGALTASKSVGHNNVETTMLYINKSMHRQDTNRRAGKAVYNEMVQLMNDRLADPK